MMKKYTILLSLLTFILGMFCSGNSYSQSRKFVSQFSHFQGYFNPALTGYEGSTVRSFVRNQWGGIEGAPKTYFLSADIDFGELAGEEDPALLGKNAVSVNLLQDNFGAFRENELTVNYAARVRLSRSHNLRLGTGVSYQSIRLDGNALTTEESDDPTIGKYYGTFSNLNVIDFNIGMALTHANYYLSYGVHRVNGGKSQRGDEFMEGYPAEHMVQAGFRQAVSENLAFTSNAFYRTRKNLPDIMELNLKLLMMDRFWIGMGHRFDYASNVQAGILTGKLRIGYVYEFPMVGSYLLPGGIHEFTVALNLFRFNERQSKDDVIMW
ncbi:type IX secretion system PorP/SprF family membrane protein [Algoriphagus aquaeductus]|uniref:Type IX secretion system PorP/SprF family membrane protein n=2 Tax=Algoriphagus aquaeductus TaxID=475299 RepID=A0A326RWA1_9BACT|nr:type IX secretion system PorP/SprF family membrane protein [Algoriphagus aquaeductus]